mgnify:FL=1|tara:strand:+ start:180 stop:479 length:300 start_codon:yes stop_codon:yes gene_type:complete
MARAKRQFSKEFKSEAVRLSYQRDNIKDLADELGIQVARIYKWRAAARTPESITTTVIKAEDQEIKKLRKQLKNAELELEILKKAVHIFSKNDGKFTNS